MKKISLLALIIFSMVSCDPPHDIYFINNSKSSAKIKIALNTKVQNSDWESIIRENDSLIFPIKQKDTVHLDFGIGQWSDSEIKKVASAVQQIEIETSDIKTTYKSQSSLESLFKSNRKGLLLQSEIYIEIK